MTRTHRDRSPDNTLALLRQVYEFGSRRFERYGSDVFQTRLLLQPAVCVRGADAARAFYDTDRFQRQGAMLMRVQKTLLGVGGVQGPDGQAHRARKQMFMSLMTPESISALGDMVGQRWRPRIPGWERADGVVLFDEVGQILCEAVSGWAGVPVAEAHVGAGTADLHAMIEAPAAVGARGTWRGRIARRRAERALAGLVERVRDGHSRFVEGPRCTSSQLTAGPAGSRWTAASPQSSCSTCCARRWRSTGSSSSPPWRCTTTRSGGRGSVTGGEQDVELFVQEVRRYYPFFPMVAARVRTPFDWQGVHFPAGRRVLLDVDGTDHHPELWQAPQDFDSDRFSAWDGDAYDFIPQCGGDHHAGHRCPGSGSPSR